MSNTITTGHWFQGRRSRLFGALGARSGGPITRTGVVFLSVGATVAILSPNDEPNNDSRPIVLLRSALLGASRKRYQEPKNDFLASMCPKWVPDTLSALTPYPPSQIARKKPGCLASARAVLPNGLGIAPRIPCIGADHEIPRPREAPFWGMRQQASLFNRQRDSSVYELPLDHHGADVEFAA